MIPGQNPTAPRESKEYAPQNGYRSYEAEHVHTDEKNWSNDRIGHERVSVQDMIARANGGVTSLDSEVDSTDQFQSDSK